MKIKKTLLSIVSAVLCMAMFLGISAFAAEKRNIWKETKALTSGKYYSDYIKLVEKYSANESKKSVTFGKSLTKKYYENQLKELDKNDPQIVFNLVSRDELVSIALKDEKIKMVMYTGGEGIGMYLDKKKMVMLSVSDKEKITIPVSADEYEDQFEDMYETLGELDDDDYMEEQLGVTNSTKGKYFKFKSGDKIYYYEEFEGDVQGTFGYLFNSKGKPIAMYAGGKAYCITYSYSKVDDSEFKIPSGYKEMDIK